MDHHFPNPRAWTATTRRLTTRLLAGAAIAAMVAGSATAYSAASAEPLFSSTSNAAAVAPAKPAAVADFSELTAAVKPAVVSVRVKAHAQQAEDESDQNGGNPGANPFEGTPFEKFFRGMPQGRGGNGFGEGRNGGQMVQAQGSGFFVSPDGYVVTNNHVVHNAVSVEIVTDDGKTIAAKVIGTDPKSELALIKVDGGGRDFPFVKLAQDKPKIGEWVVAMGNPFGLGGTVTAGIVSAQGRDIGSGPYDDYIQIDAPVNRGNSGGPTFNLKGEVIGVNTAIYSPSGGSVGIAFDIPAATVASVVPQLQKGGHVSRGWLGVQIQAVTREIADSLGLASTAGALVAEPQAGSPAASAGLKSGDVIMAVDATEIKDARDLARKIASLGPDRQIALHIIRDGHPQTIDLKLGRLQDQTVRKASVEDDGGADNQQLNALGLKVAPAAEVKGAGGTGLAVLGVDPNGRAAELGFQSGDVILKAGGKAVSSADDLAAAMAEAKSAGRKSTLVLVKHDKSDRFVALPVAVG